MDATEGQLYVLDLEGCDPLALSSVASVQHALWDIALQTGLTVMAMGVQEFPSPSAWVTGLTGWMVLAESGGMIHTTPERGVVQVELHSCRPFDPEAVRKVAEWAFRATGIIREQVIDRSLPSLAEVRRP